MKEEHLETECYVLALVVSPLLHGAHEKEADQIRLMARKKEVKYANILCTLVSTDLRTLQFDRTKVSFAGTILLPVQFKNMNKFGHNSVQAKNLL